MNSSKFNRYILLFFIMVCVISSAASARNLIWFCSTYTSNFSISLMDLVAILSKLNLTSDISLVCSRRLTRCFFVRRFPKSITKSNVPYLILSNWIAPWSSIFLTVFFYYLFNFLTPNSWLMKNGISITAIILSLFFICSCEKKTPLMGDHFLKKVIIIGPLT